MNNQRGSAVAIVLILLAAGGLMGAGLMLQSQLNNKITTAKTSRVRSLNSADWAAQLAYNSVITSQETVETQISSLNTYSKVLYASGPDSMQAWASRKTYRGVLEGGAAIPGDEEGREGDAIQVWLAEGVGDRGAGWVYGKTYHEKERVTHQGSTFECKTLHTASWENEPGVSYNAEQNITVVWQSKWDAVAPGRTVVQIAVRKKISAGE